MRVARVLPVVLVTLLVVALWSGNPQTGDNPSSMSQDTMQGTVADHDEEGRTDEPAWRKTWYLFPLDVGPKWQPTISLMNIEAQTASVTLTAYDQDGAVLGEIPGVDVLLPAEIKMLAAATVLPPGRETLKIESRGRLVGSLLLMTPDGGKSDAIPAIETAAQQLDFPPLLQEDSENKTITILNNDPDTASLEVIGLDHTGAKLQWTVLPPLGALASYTFTVQDLFSDEIRQHLATVRVISNRGIMGIQMVDPPDSDLVGLPALTETSEEWVFPIVTKAEDVELWTAVGLFNPGDVPATVKAEAFDGSANSLGIIDEASLLPGAIHFVTTSNIGGAIPPQGASLKVTADQPTSGYEVIGVKNGVGTTATLGIPSEDQPRAGFELIGSKDGQILAAAPLMVTKDGTVQSASAELLQGFWKQSLVPLQGSSGTSTLSGGSQLSTAPKPKASAQTVSTMAGPVPGLSLIWPVSPENRLNLGQDYAQFNLLENSEHHTGFDIAEPAGTVVRAAASGTVRALPMTPGVFNGDNHCMGHVVIINHGSAFTLYAHLQSITVSDGISVTQGAQIGTVGNTTTVNRPGVCGTTTPHLHFELKDRGVLGDTSDSGPNWGYTPNHPDQHGYHDPVLNLHQVTSITDTRVRVTSLGHGVSIRIGPAGYRALRTASGDEEFSAFRTSPATTSPACSAGWYQIRPTNLTQQTQIVNGVLYFTDPSRSPSSIPDAWICRGNAGEDWVMPVAPDTSKPVCNTFSVTPSSATVGNSFTISYEGCTDTGGSGLARVELWRANDTGGNPTSWAEIKRNLHSGIGPVSGSFTDAPTSTSIYWYGIHVVDNVGNWSPEPNPPGPIKVTVQAAFDFSLTNSGAISVTQGTSGSTTITRTLILGTAQPVTLTALGLPSGATASFSNNPCSPTCSSTLTIATTASTPTGTHAITITGSPGNKATSINLEVSASFEYTLTNSGAITVTQGASGTTTITGILPSGVTQSISFTASGLPTGATAAFSPPACSPTCSSTLTVSTSTFTPTGTSTITVTASPGRQTTSFTLVVNPITTVQHTLIVSVSGSGTVNGPEISCPPTCSATVADKTSVSLTAMPTSGGSFTGWSGACAGQGNPCSLTMDANKSVTATFTPSDIPAISVIPGSLDYGQVTVGSSSDLSFTVTNVGSGTLIGSVSASPDPFFRCMAGCSFSLDAGQNQAVTTRFSPGAIQTYSGTASFSSNGGDINRLLTGLGRQLKHTPTDFNGDGNSDVAVYRTSTGEWIVLSQPVVVFGGPGFFPVPADYDGDGRTDEAVYELATGHWFIRGSTGTFLTHLAFGGPGFVPVPADYDGDGRTDTAVYEQATGHWFVALSSGPFVIHPSFGGPGFFPMPGDYDGDGRDDFVVYQASTGHWFLDRSSAGFGTHLTFGGPGFAPVPADYDGDGRADTAVYEQSTGHWFIAPSSGGFVIHPSFGGPGFLPVPADYDGDGKADFGVWKDETGEWFVNTSSGGFSTVQWGAEGDLPLSLLLSTFRALGLL